MFKKKHFFSSSLSVALPCTAREKQRCFYTKRIAAKQRIGLYQQQVICTLVGNLLGDGYMEKRNNATRMHIHMSSRNVEYINWLHIFFSEKGYCSPEKL